VALLVGLLAERLVESLEASTACSESILILTGITAAIGANPPSHGSDRADCLAATIGGAGWLRPVDGASLVDPNVTHRTGNPSRGRQSYPTSAMKKSSTRLRLMF
jgi:hypothetical protein